MRPNSKHRSSTHPNSMRPNSKRPNSKRPNLKRPNSKRPNLKHPNLKHPNLKHPNLKSPNLKHPNLKRPNSCSSRRSLLPRRRPRRHRPRHRCCRRLQNRHRHRRSHQRTRKGRGKAPPKRRQNVRERRPQQPPSDNLDGVSMPFRRRGAKAFRATPCSNGRSGRPPIDIAPPPQIGPGAILVPFRGISPSKTAPRRVAGVVAGDQKPIGRAPPRIGPLILVVAPEVPKSSRRCSWLPSRDLLRAMPQIGMALCSQVSAWTRTGPHLVSV